MPTSESLVSVEASLGRPTLSASLVLDASNTRPFRKSYHACSPPFRLQNTNNQSRGPTSRTGLRRQFLLARPDETQGLARGRGNRIEPMRFSLRSAHTCAQKPHSGCRSYENLNVREAGNLDVPILMVLGSGCQNRVTGAQPPQHMHTHSAQRKSASTLRCAGSNRTRTPSLPDQDT